MGNLVLDEVEVKKWKTAYKKALKKVPPTDDREVVAAKIAFVAIGR